MNKQSNASRQIGETERYRQIEIYGDSEKIIKGREREREKIEVREIDDAIILNAWQCEFMCMFL